MSSTQTESFNVVPHFEPLLDDEDAAKLLGGMCIKTLQRMARQGEIPAVKIGRTWYFRATSLDAWIQAQCNSPARARQ